MELERALESISWIFRDATPDRLKELIDSLNPETHDGALILKAIEKATG